MKEYVISVVAVSLLSALAIFMSYGGGSERAVRAAVSVILIYTVCMPVIDLISDFSAEDLRFEFSEDTAAGESEYIAVAKEAFTEGVKKFICEEFNLNVGEVSVAVRDFDFEKMKARRIYVLLSGRAALADCSRIENAVMGAALGECEVDIKIA